MAIQDILEIIKNGIYGRDIRQAIYDGIELCYNDVIDVTSKQELVTQMNTLSGEVNDISEEVDDARIGDDQVVYPSLGLANRTQFANLKNDVNDLSEEVDDARIGDDQVVYPSLGLANRTQFANLKNDVNDVKDNFDVLNDVYTSIPDLTWESGTINTGTGANATNDTYIRTSNYLKIDTINELRITNTSDAYEIVISLFRYNGTSYVERMGGMAYHIGTKSTLNIDLSSYTGTLRMAFKRQTDEQITPSEASVLTINYDTALKDLYFNGNLNQHVIRYPFQTGNGRGMAYPLRSSISLSGEKLKVTSTVTDATKSFGFFIRLQNYGTDVDYTGHKIFVRIKGLGYANVRNPSYMRVYTAYSGGGSSPLVDRRFLTNNMAFVLSTDTNFDLAGFALYTTDGNTSGQWITIEGLQIVDLTLMFGKGLEPTAEEFSAIYPAEDLPFRELQEYSYPYDYKLLATKLANDEVEASPSEIFNIDLSNADNYSDLSGFDPNNISSGGYKSPSGWENRVQINKYIVSDYVSYRAHIKLGTAGTGKCVLGTINAGYTLSVHATIVVFDFTNRVVEFRTGASGSGGNIDGTTVPTYIYSSFPLTNLSGTEYRVEIGRKNRCVYAKVYNLTTGKLCGEDILDIYETASSYSVKAGALYDFPTFGVLSGTITFKRVSANVPTDVFVAFVGDSITEGSQLALEDVWANKAIEYLGGNGVNLGRGGGNIDHAIDCARDILPAMKPKYVVITIGTNGGNTSDKLDKLISLVKAIGAVPILNCIPMRDVSVEDVNNLILSKDTDHVRFDVATANNNNLSDGQNTSMFFSDKTHPNADGGTAMYEQFIATVGWIKQ